MSDDQSDQSWPDAIIRTVPLDDLAIRTTLTRCERCGKDATGRMVDAYAAVFASEVEIHDQYGHYTEEIAATAFNRTLGRGIDRVGVFYHHGMTLAGSPSETGKYPIAHPSSIRADQRGLLTTSHYGTDADAERVLGLIRDGTITGQSFSGRLVRSDPQRVPRYSGRGALPRVRRLELGLREYGPTPTPAYVAAQIMAMRGMSLPGWPSVDDGPASSAPPLLQDAGPGAEDPHQLVPSGRQSDIARRIRAGRVLRGIQR